MEKIVLRGHKGIGGTAEGDALVTRSPINLMSSLSIWGNAENSSFTNKVAFPELFGKSLAHKVLVFASGAGGIFSTQILMELAAHNHAPKAMVNIVAHPVFVDAAIVLGIPLVDRLDRDPTEVIKTGDRVKVDAQKGIVEVTRKQSVRSQQRSRQES